MIKFKKLHSEAKEPLRGSDAAAGIDLYNTGIIQVTRNTIDYGTGLAVEIPDSHVGLLFIRSSLGSSGHMLANSVGVIDSDYRGEIIIKLDRYKHGRARKDILYGDRIAQLVVLPIMLSEFIMVDTLSPTKRGTGGFGSTGQN